MLNQTLTKMYVPPINTRANSYESILIFFKYYTSIMIDMQTTIKCTSSISLSSIY